MDLRVELAEKKDLKELEVMSELCFKKYKLEKNFNYCKKTMTKNLTMWITSDHYMFVVVREEKDILGFVVLCEYPTMYDDSLIQLAEITMQSSPLINNILQGKVILKLIEYIEHLAKKTKARLIVLTSMPQIDISKHLYKKNYELCSNTYIRKVGE